MNNAQSVIPAAPYYKTAVMAVNYGPFTKGQHVAVKYTRTVKNLEGSPEDLFNVWVGSGAKYPSELFARALQNFVI